MTFSIIFFTHSSLIKCQTKGEAEIDRNGRRRGWGWRALLSTQGTRFNPLVPPAGGEGEAGLQASLPFPISPSTIYFCLSYLIKMEQEKRRKATRSSGVSVQALRP